MPMPAILGSAEAAKILEIGPTNFSHLRKKMIDAGDPNFPVPVTQLQCGPIWLEKDILKFKKHYDSRRRRVRTSTNGDTAAAETPPKETPKARAPRKPKATTETTEKATVTDIKPKRVLKVKQTAG